MIHGFCQSHATSQVRIRGICLPRYLAGTKQVPKPEQNSYRVRMEAGCRTQAGRCSELFGTSLWGCCSSPEPQIYYSLHWKGQGCTRRMHCRMLGRKEQNEAEPSSSWPVVSGRARRWGYQLPRMLCPPLKCVAEQAGKYCGAGGGLLLLLKLFYFTEVPQSMLKPMCFPFPESALNPSLKS